MNVKLRSLVAATIAGSFVLGFGTNAMADSTDDIVNALIAKGVLTEEEGALLMKGRAGEKEAAEEKKKSAVSAKLKDGLTFESGDGSFKAQVNGRAHADYRFYDMNEGDNNAALAGATVTNSLGGGAAGTNPNNASAGSDTGELRRARLGFKVNYKDVYEGEVVADLTGTSSTVDVAYLNVAWWKPVQFRFGVFKMPQALEQLTSSNNIDFIERSYIDQMIAGKEMGAMVHGSPFKGITYALAASNGNGRDLETDVREDGKDVTGRVTANFAEILDNKEMVLHAGLSYSQGDTPEGAVGVNGRTEGRGIRFFRAPTLGNAAGTFSGIDRERTGVEGAVAYGPFKVQGEWLRQGNEFETTTGAVNKNYDLDTESWYISALWTITGESYADAYKNGAFSSRKPKKDFDPTTFSGGLWEIGARYSEFDASDFNTAGVGIANGTDADVTTKAAGFAKADSWTLGLKFVPNANTRLMLNYVQTDFSDVIGGATGGVVINNKRVDDEKALMMRAQWMF
ncbi:MAG TPA: porin [Methylotenera sp.]|nr:porin [Methylotenera sp.]